MMKSNNKHSALSFTVHAFFLMMFSYNCLADEHKEISNSCLDEGQAVGEKIDEGVFVICVYKYEADFKMHRFTNQSLRVSIKGSGDDLLDCESNTNDSGVTVCEIDCDMESKSDRKKRIYEVKMLDVNSRQYYISKDNSTDFIELNESGFSYQFKFKNCKVVTKQPFPNNIYILYRSRELDARLRMRSRN